jgi:hypothetical protein
MKSIILLGAGLVLFMTGCASTPLVLGPIGPNPTASKSDAPVGKLQVFSRVEAQKDDQNQAGDSWPDWYQHTDYVIYGSNGKPVKHVGNTTGHYAEAPKLVTLPAGQYWVKARAKDYFWVKVPVTIKPGRITRVHLDDNWNPPADTPSKAIITEPSGHPVGWNARVASLDRHGTKAD